MPARRSRMFRRVRAGLLAMTLVGAIAGGAGPSSALPGAPTFLLSNTGSTGSELTLGVTSTNTIFLGGWDTIARSSDLGATWAHLNPRPVGFAADRVLIVDRDTNRVFVDDTDLACTVLSFSDDLGASWITNPVACGGGGTDHQKIAVGPRTSLSDPTNTLYQTNLPLPHGALYPNIVYVCANGLSHTPCAASIDGGLTFGPGFAGAHSVGCAFQGEPQAGSDGTLYQPKTACGPSVEFSTDNGTTWDSADVPGDASNDAPSIAITPDNSGYFFWTKSDWKPYLSRSTDHGHTWGAGIPIDPSIRSALFPVVAAGANGKVGVAFYGTTDNPAGWDGNPGNAPASVHWYLYAATITNAASATPTVNLVQVTTDPVQIGCLSKLGGCLNNIADYIDAEVAPNGRLMIAYVDGCPGCTTQAGSTADDGYVAIQNGGTLLN